MRYYLDTEFQEEVDELGRGILWLISIGLVCEDGRRYYAECEGFDWTRAQPWQIENVRPHLIGSTKPRQLIREELVAFVGNDPEPEFWAYVGSYDWVACMQLFGAMMNKPTTWPHSYRDLKDLMQAAGLKREDLPAQEDNLHKADDDAWWDKQAHEFIMRHSLGGTG